MFEILFVSILNMSLIASCVILFVLIARLFLKKSPKIFSYVLWAVVLFRLLCPFSFESVVSLLPTSKTPIPQDIIYSEMPKISTGISSIDSFVNPKLPEPVYGGASINPIQIWIFIGTIIWLLGVFVMIVYSLISFIKLKRCLSTATPLRDNIYLADHISTPFVMGLFRPKIYLLSGLLESEQEYIIKHEKCHVKRLDHITRILGFLALSIHWFNPLVWIAFIVSGKDMELAADESVMKTMDTDIRVQYSQSLLRFTTGRKLISATPLAFGEGDTKERVKNVLSYKKSSRIFVIFAVVMVTFLSVGSALDRTSLNADIAENKLMIKLGYTQEHLEKILENRTIYSDNSHIKEIINNLPPLAFRKLDSYSLTNNGELNISYQSNGEEYIGGNGLNPFRESVNENNALLLFASIDGVKKVNFIHYMGTELDDSTTLTIDDIRKRFGDIHPLEMDYKTLYQTIYSNIQPSEYYFAHYSRLYLGSTVDEVIYRNSDANGQIKQANKSTALIYGDFDKIDKNQSLDSWIRQIPEQTQIYYFDHPVAIENENLTGLYASMTCGENGESIDDLTFYLGDPTTEKDMGKGLTYISYLLRDRKQKNAFYFLQNNKVIAQGVMYGDDFSILELNN